MLCFLPLLMFARACASIPQAQAPTTLAQKRAAILAREVAWLDSTTPLIRFETPYMYGALRLQVEQCSKLTRTGWPTFYVAPLNPIGVDSMPSDAFYGAGKIVFALGEEASPQTVIHELLHWFLEPILPKGYASETREERTAREHPAEYFEHRCGPLLHTRH